MLRRAQRATPSARGTGPATYSRPHHPPTHSPPASPCLLPACSADKLLEDVIDNMLTKDKGELTQARREELRVMHAQAGSYKKDEIHGIFLALGIKAPATGNDLTEPFNFNLMFQTSIGPTGQLTGFLRPETAQGMFVNFRRLLDYNNGRLPMAVAQIGSAYRNEIAPRGGLLRVRCVLASHRAIGCLLASPARLPSLVPPLREDCRFSLVPSICRPSLPPHSTPPPAPPPAASSRWRRSSISWRLTARSTQSSMPSRACG